MTIWFLGKAAETHLHLFLDSDSTNMQELWCYPCRLVTTETWQCCKQVHVHKRVYLCSNVCEALARVGTSHVNKNQAWYQHAAVRTLLLCFSTTPKVSSTFKHWINQEIHWCNQLDFWIHYEGIIFLKTLDGP